MASFKKCMECGDELMIAGNCFYRLDKKKELEGFDDVCIKCRGGRYQGRVTKESYLRRVKKGYYKYPNT